MRGKFVLKLNWEGGVCRSEGTDEPIFECLDGAFGGVYPMVVWFNELQLHRLWG